MFSEVLTASIIRAMMVEEASTYETFITLTRLHGATFCLLENIVVSRYLLRFSRNISVTDQSSNSEFMNQNGKCLH
jgi:hypothetical protein